MARLAALAAVVVLALVVLTLRAPVMGSVIAGGGEGLEVKARAVDASTVAAATSNYTLILKASTGRGVIVEYSVYNGYGYPVTIEVYLAARNTEGALVLVEPMSGVEVEIVEGSYIVGGAEMYGWDLLVSSLKSPGVASLGPGDSLESVAFFGLEEGWAVEALIVKVVKPGGEEAEVIVELG